MTQYYVFWTSLFMTLVMVGDLALSPRSLHDDLKGIVFMFFLVSAIVSLSLFVF